MKKVVDVTFFKALQTVGTFSAPNPVVRRRQRELLLLLVFFFSVKYYFMSFVVPSFRAHLGMKLLD